jgi:hypothetical protein
LLHLPWIFQIMIDHDSPATMSLFGRPVFHSWYAFIARAARRVSDQTFAEICIQTHSPQQLYTPVQSQYEHRVKYSNQ